MPHRPPSPRPRRWPRRRSPWTAGADLPAGWTAGDRVAAHRRTRRRARRRPRHGVPWCRRCDPRHLCRAGPRPRLAARAGHRRRTARHGRHARRSRRPPSPGGRCRGSRRRPRCHGARRCRRWKYHGRLSLWHFRCLSRRPCGDRSGGRRCAARHRRRTRPGPGRDPAGARRRARRAARWNVRSPGASSASSGSPGRSRVVVGCDAGLAGQVADVGRWSSVISVITVPLGAGPRGAAGAVQVRLVLRPAGRRG